MRLQILCLIALHGSFAMAATTPVTWKDSSGIIVLDNGILHATFDPTTARIKSLKNRGDEVFAKPVSGDHGHNGMYHDLEATALGQQNLWSCKLTVPVATPEMVDLNFRQAWDGNPKHYPVDIDMHFVLKAGDSALYNYSVLDRKASYADFPMSYWRSTVWTAHQDPGQEYPYFDWYHLDSLRTMRSHKQGDRSLATGIGEIGQWGSGPLKGQFFGKYSQSSELMTLDAWGYSSTRHKLGFFTVQGAGDWYGGGPMKQDLTANIIVPHPGHYGSGGGFIVRQGTAWHKVYGPWLLYVNHAATPEAMFADAKARAAIERTRWPYSWVSDTGYHATTRGNVIGKLVIKDPLKPSLTGAGFWVGLVPYDSVINPKKLDSWMNYGKGYQYWNRTDKDGKISVPAVRPGTYHLFIWGPGATGMLHRDSIVITSGKATNLDTVTWTIPRTHGTFAWEIGIPERRSGHFYGNKTFFKGYASNDYHTRFPNPLVYKVGTSDWRKDWNYAHDFYSKPLIDSLTSATTWSWRKDTAVASKPWPWQIHFELSDVKAKDTALFTLAIAAANYAHLQIDLDGKGLEFYTPIASGNILVRQSDHGTVSLHTLKIPTSKLADGPHVMTLTQTANQGGGSYIMYDYLSLEVPRNGTVSLSAKSNRIPVRLAVTGNVLEISVDPSDATPVVELHDIKGQRITTSALHSGEQPGVWLQELPQNHGMLVATVHSSEGVQTKLLPRQ